ncbi:MAG: hypothetical protein GX864_02830 [Mollicutes bacterium]|jgi:uncharacterized protein (UPF0333 family)|nr:hypothetical protein [Mollicutes bacterium]
MNNRGQALVEYLLIIIIISTIAITVIGFFANQIRDTVTEVSCSLTNGEYIPGEKPGEGKCEK